MAHGARVAAEVDGVNTERWNRIKLLHAKAEGLSKEERDAFLAEECKDDPELLRAVEELLAAEGLPWTSFRPQYIYGPNTNKRDYVSLRILSILL